MVSLLARGLWVRPSTSSRSRRQEEHLHLRVAAKHGGTGVLPFITCFFLQADESLDGQPICEPRALPELPLRLDQAVPVSLLGTSVTQLMTLSQQGLVRHGPCSRWPGVLGLQEKPKPCSALPTPGSPWAAPISEGPSAYGLLLMDTLNAEPVPFLFCKELSSAGTVKDPGAPCEVPSPSHGSVVLSF